MGRLGEWAAIFFLLLHGYRIMGRRVQMGPSEIDLIATHQQTLAIIEVKTRSEHAPIFDAAFIARAVSFSQRQAIVRAGVGYAARQKWAQHYQLRVDLILVAPIYLKIFGLAKIAVGARIHHIKDAWTIDGGRAR